MQILEASVLGTKPTALIAIQAADCTPLPPTAKRGSLDASRCYCVMFAWWLVLGLTCIALSAAAAETVPQDPWFRLLSAMRQGDTVVFQEQVKHVGINGRDPKDSFARSVLHWLAQEDRFAFAQWLLDQGAAVDAKDAVDKTPLQHAIQGGADDTAALLILRGAQLELADYEGRTPLFWAVGSDNVTIANLLLERGASADATYTGAGLPNMNIRHYVAKRGYGPMVELFRSKGLIK